MGMFDSPIRPIRPVRAVRAVRPVDIRRRPSRGQLQVWLAFARRCAKRAATRLPTTPVVEPEAEHRTSAGHEVDIEA